MKERSISFNTEMVRAIPTGKKTQTRRIVKPQPKGKLFDDPLHGKWLKLDFGGLLLPTVKDLPMHCPYGQIGDQLWVQENWRFADACEGWSMDDSQPCRGWIDYEAGGDNEVTAPNFDAVEKLLPEDWDWDFLPLEFFPSKTMPRWACRLVLEITNIRVERLNDISEADCLKEGVGSPILRDCKKPKFMQLWESIFGADSWAANPWVWVVEFKVIQGGAV